MNNQELVDKINELKKSKNALILAHFYQDSEIQDVADFIGDSLALSQKGKESTADVIVMAGVKFMAESVKILSPTKKVLLPDLAAGCSLVDQSPINEFKKWRMAKPDAICVTYINSSTQVKALSDVICTSSNAEKIINAIPPDKEILFAPDKNLGRFLSKKLNRPMTLWPGSCQVHVLFSVQKLYELTQEHPDAKVIAHPECMDGILDQAQVIGSTNALLEEVKKHPGAKFIVATETGILHQMQKANPTATLIQAPATDGCACNDCPYMKLNTLQKLYECLAHEKPEISLTAQEISDARLPLERMLSISRGETVSWTSAMSSEVAQNYLS